MEEDTGAETALYVKGEPPVLLPKTAIKSSPKKTRKVSGRVPFDVFFHILQEKTDDKTSESKDAQEGNKENIEGGNSSGKKPKKYKPKAKPKKSKLPVSTGVEGESIASESTKSKPYKKNKKEKVSAGDENVEVLTPGVEEGKKVKKSKKPKKPLATVDANDTPVASDDTKVEQKIKKNKKPKKVKTKASQTLLADANHISISKESAEKDVTSEHDEKPASAVPVSRGNESPFVDASPSGLKSKSSSPQAQEVEDRAKDEINPFNIKLRSVKSTHANKKYAERLTKIEPIETIMGLTHEQVLKLAPNDFVINKVIAQADKSLQPILKTIQKEPFKALGDEHRHDFRAFCMEIALYEAKGFCHLNTMAPYLVDQLNEFEELKLQNTQTAITKSTKKVHANDFDYSVLGLIGNIAIWYGHVHNLHYVSQKEVRARFGGYHLWDQLFKEETINMKRWKHIIKNRETWPLQVNQFEVIMRFINLGG